MTLQERVGGLAPEAWRVESLRFTGFPSPSIDLTVTASEWWQALFGEPPETRTERPRQRGFQEEGAFKDGQLFLAVEPARVDWVAARPRDFELDPLLEAFPTFDEALPPFIDLVRRWIRLGSSVVLRRLAFGAVLVRATANRQSGYQQLSTYLHLTDFNFANASDFLFQINRPRQSRNGPGDLTVNRLSKWSVALWGLAQFTLGGGTAIVSSGPEIYGTRLELDINTSPDFTDDFPPDWQLSVFEELVMLGGEIASQGDIP